MFRKIYLVGLLFFAMGLVSGQGVKFGIKFDPTITWLRSDVKEVMPYRAYLGFDLGMTVDNYFSKNYAFATGISLFNTGGTLKYLKAIELFTKDGKIKIEPGDNVKYKVQYVKVPIAMKFKTHMIGRFVYSANLGFDPMIRISGRADFYNEKSANVNDEIKFLNAGWHFGGGAHYSLGGEVALFFGLSYMSAFMDMTKPAFDMITSNNLFYRIGIIF